MIRSTVIGLMLAAFIALPAAAGPLENGLAAYERGDYKSAYTLLLPLARRGNATAQAAIGVIYHHGLSIKADLTKAIEWYAKAASGGDTLAQRTLGDLHVEGVSGTPDYKAAADWYEEAAAGGDLEARRKLQVLQSSGRITRRSPRGAGGRGTAYRQPQRQALAQPRSGKHKPRRRRLRGSGKRPASCMSGMADAPYHIDIKAEFPPVKFDHTRSIADLGKISGAGHRRRILGLMKPDFRLRTLPRSESLSSGGQYCFWISGFEVILRYAQVHVYVAREYAKGSCEYDAILEHEMEHVTVARKNLEEYAPRIRDALERGSVPTAQTPIIVASAADAARDVKEISRENLEPIYRSMLRALYIAQRKVDSPQSYAAVFRKCSNW
ncbi:MAG TPA: tetratricopeptide repeat protein [Alphaproteobacteria bacterium]|nr:tetratricopeptide repeat protein [Alphaproteobacteria bacterium]